MPEIKKQSFEDELISAFLTKSTEKARQQIADEEKLSTKNAIPLMLKSQFQPHRPFGRTDGHQNRIREKIENLKEQMVTKTEFREENESLKEQMVTKTEFNSF